MNYFTEETGSFPDADNIITDLRLESCAETNATVFVCGIQTPPTPW